MQPCTCHVVMSCTHQSVDPLIGALDSTPDTNTKTNSKLHYLLGYFALVGLNRLECLLGDFQARRQQQLLYMDIHMLYMCVCARASLCACARVCRSVCCVQNKYMCIMRVHDAPLHTHSNTTPTPTTHLHNSRARSPSRSPSWRTRARPTPGAGACCSPRRSSRRCRCTTTSASPTS